MNIKYRNPALVIIYSIITFGNYAIVWFAKTKNEINSLGGTIPTILLIFLPIFNIYFLYQFADNFSRIIKKDENSLLWFLVLFVVGPVGMILIQIELNKLSQRLLTAETIQ